MRQDDVRFTENLLSDGSEVYSVTFQNKARFDCIDRIRAARLANALAGCALGCEIVPALAADHAESIYRDGWSDGADYDGDRDPSGNPKVAEDVAWSCSITRARLTGAVLADAPSPEGYEAVTLAFPAGR